MDVDTGNALEPLGAYNSGWEVPLDDIEIDLDKKWRVALLSGTSFCQNARFDIKPLLLDLH